MQYIIPKEDYIHGGTQKDFYDLNETEKVSCLFCGSSEHRLVYTERGNLGTCICNRCGLVYTSPRPKDTEQNYFGQADLFYSEARLVFKGKREHHRDKNYIFELEEVKKFKPNSKLLDVGSNAGFFLRKAVALGFDAEGVEPSPSLAEISRKEFNLKVTNSFFEEAQFPDKHFDVITLIDVFEHVTRPQNILKEARRVMKDDGLICIKVPNAEYNLLKLRMAKAAGRLAQHDIFNSFEHVVHYTPGTMKKMVESCGLKIKKLVLPLPIDIPIWHLYTGHYYAYPTPFALDWKRVIGRRIFLTAGKIQKLLGMKITASPDLMFLVEKK